MNNSHHWLPRHGSPRYIIDYIVQGIVKITAYLPLYTAVICTVTFLLIIFGVPFIGGN